MTDNGGKKEMQEAPQLKDTADLQQSLETRSVVSVSSKASSKSVISSSSRGSSKLSASMTAAKARARVEAARARSAFVKRETEVMVEKAQLKVQEAHMEAALAILQHEKEVAAATAEAEVLEIAAAELEQGEDGRKVDIGFTPHDSKKLTSDYVEHHSKLHSSQLSLHSLEPFTPPLQLHDDCSDQVQTDALHHITRAGDRPRQNPKPNKLPLRDVSGDNMHLPAAHFDPALQPRTPFPSKAIPQVPTHNTTGMNDIAMYLVRRELVNSGLVKFDDCPENYWAWKSSFTNAMEGLHLTASEELDLLTKWLGPQSSEHVKRIRAVHVSQPAAGLKMAWERLEECYGSPEVIEKALFEKLEKFPKISNKDPLKLRELGDLLRELECAKSEGYLPGLTYLDTARGVNPIVEKLPYGLQEKWMARGSQYKRQFHVPFPPFSFFTSFVCREAHTRNDPSFNLCSASASPLRSELPGKRYGHTKSHVSAHKTEITPTPTSSRTESPKGRPDVDRQCPIHKKPHPLKRCRGFRSKTLEERKAFLKENGTCFRCCSSNNHFAKDCKVAVQCKECNSDRHVTALHPGPAPWTLKGPDSEHGGEEEGEKPPSDVNSKCTEVCGEGLSPKSCSKICLIKVFPKGNSERSARVYAILDDQSNKSLARSEFFDLFNLEGTDSPYTLRTCSGVTETSGRRATGFLAESLDGGTSVLLPTLIECNHMPDDRSEIPTPEAAKHHSHMKSIAHLIPALDPNAQILLLLGRDILQVHKVREQRNGPHNAPYAQRLDLGWVVVGDVCLGTAHKLGTVKTYRTNVLDNGRPSHFSPCPNHLYLKEKFAAKNSYQTLPSYSLALDSKDSTLGTTIFERTKDDEKMAPSIEDRLFLELMDKEMFMDDSNSWVAPLPFRSPRPHLPNNREQALSRLASLCRTLEKKPEMKDHFVAFMQKIFDRDHAEQAPPLKEGEECWYLPTFGVYHPRKPGQIRVVFDSSAQHLGVSLNDVLLTGPNLNNSLLGVLLRFRCERVAITADIEQMFHSFLVREDHRNFLRFLWYRDNDSSKDIIEYRMKVHVFGNSPSPAVAVYGLRCAASHEEVEYGADVRHFVERDFYVDDGLKSLPTAAEAIDLLKRTQKALAISNLRLHKVASNSAMVMEAFPSDDHAKDLKDLDLDVDSPPVQRSLGLSWNLKRDAFTFCVTTSEKPFTRRGVLATINSLFDPLGFVAPITIQGKLLLRELTNVALDWDTPLPQEKEAEWNAWRDSLQDLQQFETPRAYTATFLSKAQRKEIHIFSDASVKAIAAVAYLRVMDHEGVWHVGFILGRAKLAPQSVHTIPRLELGAAVLAVEVAELIVCEMDIELGAVEFYTDSKVVLGYICNQTRRFYVYVSNRVQRIRRFSRPEQWHYVHTAQNPADIATRSVPAAHLSQTTWLTGPAFLLHTGETRTTEEMSYELIDPESDVEVRSHVTTCQNIGLGAYRFGRFSSWKSLTRAVASLVHISHCYKTTDHEQKENCNGWHHCTKPHTSDELAKAKAVIIGCTQREAYKVEFTCLEKGKEIPKNSPLRKLNPIIDEEGLLRIGGRLKHSALNTAEKHPLIIPGRSHVATLLTNYYHERVKHQGRVFTEGAIRTGGIWIVGAKRCINSNLRKCVTCKKLSGRTAEQKMADLPSDRLSAEPPFTYVGLDVFGPWTIASRRTRGGQANSKRWAVLFTCMSVRAVHIELIESMDTSSFINALRRFFALRGPAKQIRSDCGTNFIGACKELKILLADTNKPSVRKYLGEEGCTWIFNPPHSSHMGGAWERMIGISRRILDSMLQQIGPSRLTHEVLSTLMAEVTTIMNARPLTPISTDPDSPFLLTPAMVLTQKVCTPLPPPGAFDNTDLYRQQWKKVQHLANTFWERWRREYLATLQSRSKWQEDRPNIKVGDLVLLKDSQVKRNEWPLALVTEAFLDSDGKVRKVELKVTKHGTPRTFFRPVSEVVLLMSP
ncbi:uncharacterized protein LOC131737334 [Acipenser ruthenus]|uniref:uncharacterized protein LOC131737334 n=1 Tax=Acipenser ruthenus TaxID=7906 RepID=UPI00274120C4|nr:uncharacterized protein LOC131737334 [Acipenser ruthenus]